SLLLKTMLEWVKRTTRYLLPKVSSSFPSFIQLFKVKNYCLIIIVPQNNDGVNNEMPELTREEKLKLVEKLPQQLQDLLYSEDTGAFLLYLGKKYNLPDEKIRLLSKLVADVILRITPITSLAQEINSKITSDTQAAMNLAQELNTELLAPVMAAPSAPQAPAMPSAPVAPATPKTTSPTPPYQGGEKREVVSPSPRIDGYREPTFSMPEIVDLRKTPPAVSKVEPPPAPVFTPKPVTPTPPLTFTRPIEPAAPATPLIEAEPHKIPIPAEKPIVSAPKPIDVYRELPETQNPPPVSAPIPISTPPASEPRPQYIMRPSGAPPTDLPDNVLDLRKDRGEF
ncbi:MAG: hypothetical protein NTV77_00700, partial [Candidatus Azambacteria bacterium]|nr:hypothetical protein [Candidatus Azambacteria bacterium]